MTTNEMKKVLAEKLADEGTYFTFKDISIKKASRTFEGAYDEDLDDYINVNVDGYEIVIKEYEHIHFFIYEEEDEYFGNVVYIARIDYWKGEEQGEDVIEMRDSKHKTFEALTKEALVYLGYYIGTRF